MRKYNNKCIQLGKKSAREDPQQQNPIIFREKNEPRKKSSINTFWDDVCIKSLVHRRNKPVVGVLVDG